VFRFRHQGDTFYDVTPDVVLWLMDPQRDEAIGMGIEDLCHNCMEVGLRGHRGTEPIIGAIHVSGASAAHFKLEDVLDGIRSLVIYDGIELDEVVVGYWNDSSHYSTRRMEQLTRVLARKRIRLTTLPRPVERAGTMVVSVEGAARLVFEQQEDGRLVASMPPTRWRPVTGEDTIHLWDEAGDDAALRALVTNPSTYRDSPNTYGDPLVQLHERRHFTAVLEAAMRSLPDEWRAALRAELAALLDDPALLPLSSRQVEERVYAFIKHRVGNQQPMRLLKRAGQEAALALLPWLSDQMGAEPWLGEQGKRAIELAMAGNRASSEPFREAALAGPSALAAYVQSIAKVPSLSRDDRARFLEASRKHPGAEVLYVLDNVVEDVFDLALVRWLLVQGHCVTLAAKAEEADNDVTVEDARWLLAQPVVQEFLGGDTMLARVRIVSSGSVARGTSLLRATPEFVEAWQRAAFIISKGEGNRGGLQGVTKEVFHLLVAKHGFRNPGLPEGLGAIEYVPAIIPLLEPMVEQPTPNSVRLNTDRMARLLQQEGVFEHPLVTSAVILTSPDQSQVLLAKRPDGLWHEEEFTGTGFPNAFYLRYHYYPKYFPVLALSAYRNALGLHS
jgi:uncharacterized protein with ATP-grasp and redox domains